MEITEIDGRKASDILDRIWRMESGDGDIMTGKQMHIGTLHNTTGRYSNARTTAW